MPRAKKLPSGNWRVQVSVGKDTSGKYKYKSFTAPTRKEAEYLAATYTLTLKDEQSPVAPTRITLDAAIREWIDNRRNILSPSTTRMYDSIQRCAFGPIRNTAVVALSLRDIQGALNTYAATHSPKSVRNAYGLLHSVLSEYAPTLNLNAINLPPKEDREIHIPDTDQVKLMIRYLRETDDTEMLIAVLLAAMLGMRRSEICALERRDFEENTVNITKAIVLSYDNKTFVMKGTKTRAGRRTLNVSRDIYEYVMRCTQATLPGDRIISLSPDSITRRYRTLAKRFGLSTRFHDLRHYYASVLAALNIPVKSAMVRLGHSTPDTTQTIYQHTLRSFEHQFDDAIDSHCSSLLE